MWIKLDRNLMESGIMSMCRIAEKPTDNTMYIREVACMNLFIHSANDMMWRSGKDLSKSIHMPLKSCERVWDLCMQTGVLAEVRTGMYNAKKWLIERGYLGNASTARQAVEAKNAW